MASDEGLVNYGLGAARDARLDIASNDYALTRRRSSKPSSQM